MVKIDWPKYGKYVRIRIKSPKSFIWGSFRTHDIGRLGHSKRIAVRLKRTRKWATQTYLIPKKEYGRTKQAKRLMSQIRARH